MTDAIQEGSIVYRFKTPAEDANTLYVNMIGRYGCWNDCLFCGRPRLDPAEGSDGSGGWRPNVYEEKAGTSLYLRKSPSVVTVLDAIDNEIKQEDREIAIVGLGEPLMELPKVCGVIGSIKGKYGVHKIGVRVDTDGLVKCVYPEPAKRLEDAGLDEVRISVNAVNGEDYVRLCRPTLGSTPWVFGKLVDFVRDCVSSSMITKASFVIGFECDDPSGRGGMIATRPQQEYEDFAGTLGIPPEDIIWRQYVPTPD
ncbi:MAG: radical SAM protein [Candidatus Aenigmarchaeota archaeon]|nr:radical SAM protein [Candidatus Aenigmarchaeota archaeon]